MEGTGRVEQREEAVEDAGLVARGIEVRIGGRALVRDVDLTVAAGELCAVIGVSGSGKSTLLRVLAGVDIPTTGHVTYDGVPVAQRTDLVGYVPFGDLVHPELTVREALGYAAALRVPTAEAGEREARVEQVISELRMDDRADSRVGSLSDGERRRVACGSELVGQPRVLVLDEPTTGLDPDLQRRLMLFVRGLADQGLAVLIATHATASLELCDRIAVLGPTGTVRFWGTRAELLAHFGIETIDDVYDAAQPAPGEEPPPVRDPIPPPPDAELPPLPSLGLQVSTLASRYATCKRRQRRSLALLLGQAPIIGIAIGAAIPAAALDSVDLTPFYSLLVAFILVISSIWLGVVSACREIAREGQILMREVAFGVRIDAYLLSKCAVLLPIVAAQVVLLVLPLMVLHPFGGSRAAYVEGLPLFVVAGFAGALIGLFVSAAVRTAGQATALIPVVMIPQLLLAGALIPHDKMVGPLRLLSDTMVARWALAGSGSAFDLEKRISGNLDTITGLSPSFFSFNPGVALLLVIAIGLASFIAAQLVLARRVTDATPGRAAHD